MRVIKTRTFTLKKLALAMIVAAGTLTTVYAATTGPTSTIQGVAPVLSNSAGDHAVSFTKSGTAGEPLVTGDTLTMTYIYNDYEGDTDASALGHTAGGGSIPGPTTASVRWWYVTSNGTGSPVEITTGITNTNATSSSGGTGTSVLIIPEAALGSVIKAEIIEASSTGDIRVGRTITYNNVALAGTFSPDPSNPGNPGGPTPGPVTEIPTGPIEPGSGVVPGIYLADATVFDATTNLIATGEKPKVGSTYIFKLYSTSYAQDLTSTVDYKWKLNGTTATAGTAAPTDTFRANQSFPALTNTAASAYVTSPDGIQGLTLEVIYDAKTE